MKYRLSFIRVAGVFFLCLFVGCTTSRSDKAAELKERAQTYYERGAYREASIDYQAALQYEAEDVEAAYGLAKCLNAMGQHQEYKNRLEMILKNNPEHVEAGIELGSLYWAAGRYEDSLVLAKRFISLNSDLLEARKLEARVFSALGRFDEARASWRAVFELSPDEQSYVEAASLESYLGNTDQARSHIYNGLEKFPGSLALLLASADLSSLLGEFEKAEKAIESAETVDPQNVKVYMAKANFLLRKGNVDEALIGLEDDHSKLSGDNLKSIEMARARSDFFLGLGDIEAAGAVLEKELVLNVDHPELSASLINILLFKGETGKAKVLLSSLKGSSVWRIARLLEARLYLLEGRSNWALSILENVVASGDLSVDAQFLYAKALAQEERLAKAKEVYSKILRRMPDHFFARLDMVSLLRAQKSYDEAYEALKLIRRPWRDHPRIQLLLARILLEKGELKEADRLAQSFLKTAPENMSVWMLAADVDKASGRIEKALSRYARASELAPKALEPVFSAVALYEANGSLREAISMLEQYIEVTDNPMALNRLADLQLKNGDLSSALGSADRSIIVEPNYWRSRIIRARIFLASREDSKAILELEDAVNLDPERPEAYNMLADVYLVKGNVDKAEAQYRRLLDRNPGEPITLNNLANLFIEQNKISEAMKYAEAAYEAAPNSPSILDTLGWTHSLSGNHEKAHVFLNRAIALFPGQQQILFHWAKNKLEMGDKTAGENVLEKVIKIDPKSKTASEALELLREQGGR